MVMEMMWRSLHTFYKRLWRLYTVLGSSALLFISACFWLTFIYFSLKGVHYEHFLQAAIRDVSALEFSGAFPVESEAQRQWLLAHTCHTPSCHTTQDATPGGVPGVARCFAPSGLDAPSMLDGGRGECVGAMAGAWGSGVYAAVLHTVQSSIHTTLRQSLIAGSAMGRVDGAEVENNTGTTEDEEVTLGPRVYHHIGAPSSAVQTLLAADASTVMMHDCAQWTSSIPAHARVVLVGACGEGKNTPPAFEASEASETSEVSEVSFPPAFEHVYGYLDDVSVSIARVRTAFPGVLVVWSKPQYLVDSLPSGVSSMVRRASTGADGEEGDPGAGWRCRGTDTTCEYFSSEHSIPSSSHTRGRAREADLSEQTLALLPHTLYRDVAATLEYLVLKHLVHAHGAAVFDYDARRELVEAGVSSSEDRGGGGGGGGGGGEGRGGSVTAVGARAVLNALDSFVASLPGTAGPGLGPYYTSTGTSADWRESTYIAEDTDSPADSAASTVSVDGIDGTERPVRVAVQRPVTTLVATCPAALVVSRKYDSRCMPAPSAGGRVPEELHARRHTLLPLLVTGLGGGGTTWVATQLALWGIDARHERIGRAGAVSWYYSISDVLVGRPYPCGAHVALAPAVYPDLPYTTYASFAAWARWYGPISHRTVGVSLEAITASLFYDPHDWLSIFRPDTSAVIAPSFLVPRFERVVHLRRAPERHVSTFSAHTHRSFRFVVAGLRRAQALGALPTKASAGAGGSGGGSGSGSGNGSGSGSSSGDSVPGPAPTVHTGVEADTFGTLGTLDAFDTLDSFGTGNNTSHSCLMPHISRGAPCRLPLAVHSLVAWQQLVDAYADAHVRVEDFGRDMTAAAAPLAFILQDEQRANMSGLPLAPLLPNRRHQHHREYSLQMILAVAPDSAYYFATSTPTSTPTPTPTPAVNGPMTPYTYEVQDFV